jgi:shikimate kinase
MTKPQRIFILGHSGAGKGVLADAVAKKLGWNYIDADFALAPSIGRTLPEILGNEGVHSFYKCLTEVITHLKSRDQIVVTTDDSIINNETIRQLLKDEFTVYVEVSTKVQLERITHNRPLLPVSNYPAFLDKLHQEYDSLYTQTATFSLSSDNGELDKHANSVVEAFHKG